MGRDKPPPPSKADKKKKGKGKEPVQKRCECERRCECGIRPERPTKKDGKPDYGFRWDGEVQKWVSNHRSNEAGGPPADGPPRYKKPAVGDLLIYFVCCPCAVGYFLWVSAPAC